MLKFLLLILQLIVDIQPIAHLPRYLAAVVFGIYQGVFTGIAHIGISLESSRKGRVIINKIFPWVLYVLLAWHLGEWMLVHTLRFLLRGGGYALILATVVWFGVFLLFYFPQVRRPLYKIFSWAPFYRIKVKKGSIYREAVEYFKSHDVAAISIEEDKIYFYKESEAELEKNELEVIYDNGHIHGTFTDPALEPVNSIAFDFPQGSLECAVYARLLSKALKLKKYMHISQDESYTYKTVSYDVVHVYGYKGNVSASAGKKTDTTITRRSIMLLWRFYLSAK